MTAVEAQLLILGCLMVASASWAYYRTGKSWLVIAVVFTFIAVAFKLGLIV